MTRKWIFNHLVQTYTQSHTHASGSQSITSQTSTPTSWKRSRRPFWGFVCQPPPAKNNRLVDSTLGVKVEQPLT